MLQTSACGSATQSKIERAIIMGKTVYILGAGASYSSDAPEVKIPMQKGFFSAIKKSGHMPMMFDLEKLNDPEMRKWLQEHNYVDDRGDCMDCKLTNDENINLEDFYTQVETDRLTPPDIRKRLMAILDYIIFKAMSVPVVSIRNYPEKNCRLHKKLVEMLKPGDTIISFNYDCLIDDALLYFCNLWYPHTGYGISFNKIEGDFPPYKTQPRESEVLLLKPHGSVTFRRKNKKIMLLGLVNGIQPLTMSFSGGWKPFIVSPSSLKKTHTKYLEKILRQAKIEIKNAHHLVVIGYSFPINDKHVAKILKTVPKRITIVNPNHGEKDFVSRLTSFGISKFDAFYDMEEYLNN